MIRFVAIPMLIIGLIGSIVELLGCVNLGMYIPGISCSATPHAVFVQSPEVYTRARLLNDRIEQQNWLTRQLKIADTAEKFTTPDEVRHLRTVEALRLALASEKKSDDAGKADKDDKERAKVPNATQARAVSVLQSYKAMRGYRDEIRSELSRVQLDDRHDIGGNTVYTLRFPVSVLGDYGPNKVGVVHVTADFKGAKAARAPSTADGNGRQPQVEAPAATVGEAQRLVEASAEHWRRQVEKLYSASVREIGTAITDTRTFKDSALNASDLRAYVMHKLLCARSVDYCPPHERDLLDEAEPDTRSMRGRDGRTLVPPVLGMHSTDSEYRRQWADALRQFVLSVDERLTEHIEEQSLLDRTDAKITFYRDQLDLLMKADDQLATVGHAKDDGRFTKAGLLRFDVANRLCDNALKVPNWEDVIAFPPGSASSDLRDLDIVQGRQDSKLWLILRVNDDTSSAASKPPKPSTWIKVSTCPRRSTELSVVGVIFRLVGAASFGFTSTSVDRALHRVEKDRRQLKIDRTSNLKDFTNAYFTRISANIKRCQEDLERRAKLAEDGTDVPVELRRRLSGPRPEDCLLLLGEQDEARGLGDLDDTTAAAKFDRLRCAIADLRAYSAVWPRYLSPTGRQISFGDFVDVIPIRHGLRGCDIEVRVKYPGRVEHPNIRCPEYGKDPAAGLTTYEISLCMLHAELTYKSDLFAYALSPSIHSRTIDRQIEAAKQQSASATVPTPSAMQSISAVLDASRNTTSVTTYDEATLISFVHRSSEDEGGNRERAQFGWIILSDGQNIGGRQLDLSVGISVPGWLGELPLMIAACAVHPRELEKAAAYVSSPGGGHAPQICPHARPYVLKLPGDPAEITRKLNLAVFNVPRLKTLTENAAPMELRAGSPGSLIITGHRLWKNTYVSLGQQLANEISILPDMEGIVAKFNCVHVPNELIDATVRRRGAPANRQASQQPVRDPQPMDVIARVWTSEGVTEPIIVRVRRIGETTLCQDQDIPEPAQKQP